jgi:hypothetical protein
MGKEMKKLSQLLMPLIALTLLVVTLLAGKIEQSYKNTELLYT